MRRRIWNIAIRLLVVLPFVLIVFLMLGRFRFLERRNTLDKISAEHDRHLELISFIVNSVFEEYHETLNIIASSNDCLQYLANPSEQTQEEFLQAIMRVAGNRRYIKGISVSSTEGVNLFGMTHFTDELLPFHWPAPYVSNWERISPMIQNLQEGQVGFSPFSYASQMVDGECLSLIGVQIPVYYQGRFSFILGMLVDGRSILDLVSQTLSNHPPSFMFGLLDTNGDYMLIQDDAAIQGPCIQRTSFADRAPQFWDYMQTNDGDSFITKGIRYSYLAINPLKELAPFYSTFHHLMVAYYSFPEEEILRTEGPFIARSRWFQWVATIIILIISWALSLLNYFRKQTKELLEVSSLVSDQSHDGVLIVNLVGHTVYCNNTLSLITGFDEEEIYKQSINVFDLNGESFSLRPRAEKWQGFVWLQGKYHTLLAHLMLDTVTLSIGGGSRSVALFSNPRNLAKESYQDLLSITPDKETPFEHYPLQLLHKKSLSDQPFVTMYVKIENIDLIESQYSLSEHYLLGTEIIRRIKDSNNHDSLIIQYSPDTYLLAVAANEEDMSAIYENIHTTLSSPITITEGRQHLRISMGISAPSSPKTTVEDLLHQCRIALAGLNHHQETGFLSYSKEISNELARYYSIVDAFDEALEQRSIQLNYQPVIDIKTNRIIGVEALARWVHPELGPISPGEFIPIVEEQKMERKLGRYVIEEVCSCMARLQERGIKGISFSINLCPTELQDKHLVSHIVETLDAYNLEHKHLIIELTERSLLSDLESVNIVLDQLAQNNIEVAIDDFGTGFSSLKYLHELNVDIIKIDRSFIQHYPDSDEGIILRAMVGMTKELEIPIMVEGIETEEQLHFIKTLNVPYYQGFLFSKAVDEEALVNLLQLST